jgi:hypothetical protein
MKTDPAKPQATTEKPNAKKTGQNGGAREGAGRPAFVPTAAERKQVEALSGYGLTIEMIRHLVRDGIAIETVLTHFRAELDAGKAKANAQVGKRLFQKVMEGDTTAMIWWTKTQMRWSETQKVEITGAAGGPIQTVDLSKVSTEALLELSKAIADATPQDHDGRQRLN